jgi:glutamine synthetase
MNQLLQSHLDFIKNNKIDMIDLKFVNLFGGWHHLTIPVSQFTEKLVAEGIPFDGSSIPGFKKIAAADMVAIPDLNTMQVDPFWENNVVSFICRTCEALTLEPFRNDPRVILQRTEQYLLDSGIADGSLWSPEFEFYIFDSINYKNDINLAFYQIDSKEADWNSMSEEDGNLGYKIPRQGGYHAIPPMDTLFNLRARMVHQILQAGIPVRYHHHEVGGPGQSEIEIPMIGVPMVGDYTMSVKYIIKNVASKHNKTVTFMPKPLYNEAGSGMHFHQTLVKNGKSMFYDPHGYAHLSDVALHYIGGLLLHGRALTALTNPSTISYKRLIPGFEAPVRLFYGIANRSAAIRIPKYGDNSDEKRIEFRPPDATCNPYLATAAQLLAGIDGIQRKIDPIAREWGPIDEDVRKIDSERLEKIAVLPVSLNESLEALKGDCDFLLQDGIFDEDFLQRWIEYKMEYEYNEVRFRPHPFEVHLYFDV